MEEIENNVYVQKGEIATLEKCQMKNYDKSHSVFYIQKTSPYRLEEFLKPIPRKMTKFPQICTNFSEQCDCNLQSVRNEQGKYLWFCKKVHSFEV